MPQKMLWTSSFFLINVNEGRVLIFPLGRIFDIFYMGALCNLEMRKK